LSPIRSSILPMSEQYFDNVVEQQWIEQALAYQFPAHVEREARGSALLILEAYPYRYYSPSREIWFGIGNALPQMLHHSDGHWLYTTQPLLLKQIATLEVIPAEDEERIRVALAYYHTRFAIDSLMIWRSTQTEQLAGVVVTQEGSVWNARFFTRTGAAEQQSSTNLFEIMHNIFKREYVKPANPTLLSTLQRLPGMAQGITTQLAKKE
jgi:hypothetical protein